MASSHCKWPGVTRPVNVQEPTDDDVSQSEELRAYLSMLDAFENTEGKHKRDKVVSFIETVVKRWVKQTAERLEIEPVEDFGAQVLAFGSHVLNVISKDSDIDAVCIVPQFIEREEFFTHFASLLRGVFEPEVSQIRLVQGARVPIIEINIGGYEADLCLACLATDKIPLDLDVMDDNILRDLSLTDSRSLNGRREVCRVLQLVPDLDTYQTTLKAVKLWAKAQCIHNSALGYPGGIGWAIMVARVCQLYPTALPAQLLLQFFKVFSDWQWPTPVILAPVTKTDDFDLKPWNAKKNPSDGFHIMPIITPAYPEKNCAFSVTMSGLQLTKERLAEAYQLTKDIRYNEKPWEDLYKKLDFFSMYKHFLMLTASAANPQDLLNWAGLIQARSRVFVESIEKQTLVRCVHAYPKKYQEGMTSTRWFWGLQFTQTKGVKLRLAEDLQMFQDHLIDLARSRKMYKDGMYLQVTHVRRKDIQAFFPDVSV